MEENVNNAQEKVRYSDEELMEFKELILEKLARARKDLELLNENVSGGDNNADDTAPTFKVLEESGGLISLVRIIMMKLSAKRFAVIWAITAVIMVLSAVFGLQGQLLILYPIFAKSSTILFASVSALPISASAIFFL